MMKYLNKIIVLLVFTLVLASCDKNENFEILPAQESFQIVTPSSGTVMVLNGTNLDNNALFLSWESFNASTGPFSIEMATEETFIEPILLGNSDENSFSLTVKEFNNVLLNAGIKAFAEMPIYIRILETENITNYVNLVVTTFPESNPIITSPESGLEIVLSDITADETAVTVNWEDSDFDENSTVTVNYDIEVAVAGTDFASIYSLGTTEDLTLDVIHSVLNDAALELGLTPGEISNLDLRIKAAFETASDPIERFSDFITISVTPYKTALEPILFAVGAGVPDAGWGWDSPVQLTLQGAIYSGNVNFANDAFRFFADSTLEWDSPSFNYPYFEERGYTIDANFENALDGDSNFKFIGTPGEYFLSIDTENKVISLGPPVVGPNCEYDQLWLVGAGIADAGWNWDSPVALPCIGTGVYAGNVNFANDAFRFFAQQDWGPTSFNYPYYEGEGYTIDADFENANDGDSNFKFIGIEGEYYLSVDTINKTITLSAPQTNCEYDQLWLVGGGVPDAGWNWDSPVDFPCTGAGVYSAQVTFSNDAFRFFAQQDWGPTSFNYPYYEGEGYTIDADFENAEDGDSNFKFIGTPGTYVLTLDTVNKTITLE